MNNEIVILGQAGLSADWRDYVALIAFLVIAPVIWWCARAIWRSFPEAARHQPETIQNTTQHRPVPSGVSPYNRE
jgi:hypothetical protein